MCILVLCFVMGCVCFGSLFCNGLCVFGFFVLWWAVCVLVLCFVMGCVCLGSLFCNRLCFGSFVLWLCAPFWRNSTYDYYYVCCQNWMQHSWQQCAFAWHFFMIACYKHGLKSLYNVSISLWLHMYQTKIHMCWCLMSLYNVSMSLWLCHVCAR